jgi:hypothetical protein
VPLQSLQNVKTKWLPEAEQAIKKEKISATKDSSKPAAVPPSEQKEVFGVLCGTKCDQVFAGCDLDYLEEDEFNESMSEIMIQAEALNKSSDLIKQMYCTSSLLGNNVKNSFDFIITQVMAKRKGLKQVMIDD